MELETPLLVPSFSSKGFKFRKKNGKLYSEALDFINPTGYALKDVALISAYDLKYSYMKPPSSRHAYNPELFIIDSGGFETIEGTDFSDVYQYPVKPETWTKELYIEELEKWNRSRYPIVLVSYDNGLENRRNLSKQISDAHELFERFPDCLFTFLIKATKKNAYLNIPEIILNVEKLKDFPIIGVTEKELGASILIRMQNIAKLRLALDAANIKNPIHIFGSLDPITSSLYFISGAEIFDGLTWLRYSYHNGVSIYGHNKYALDFKISEKDNLLRGLLFVDNLMKLRTLQHEMRAYAKNGEDITKFTLNTDAIKKGRDQLMESLI